MNESPQIGQNNGGKWCYHYAYINQSLLSLYIRPKTLIQNVTFPFSNIISDIIVEQSQIFLLFRRKSNIFI